MSNSDLEDQINDVVAAAVAEERERCADLAAKGVRAMGYIEPHSNAATKIAMDILAGIRNPKE